MLKLKSVFLGLCVFVHTGFALTIDGFCSADDELLPEFANEIIGAAQGNEKSCSSELPVPGVSFPTQLYGQHASAYENCIVFLVPVQAGVLPVTSKEGWMKSEQTVDSQSDVIEIIAKGKDVDRVPEIGAASEIPEARVREWRAARNSMSRGVVDFEMGQLTLIPYDLPMVASDNLQTVAYQDTPDSETATETVSEVRASEPADLSTGAKKADGLFSSLGEVRLGNAIHSRAELPDQLNEGEEYFDKAGTLRNWSTGTWISFRPRRNTFPFHHNPLYFEDPNLERCGRTSGYFTEITSFAHFAGRIPALPYMMTVERPCSLVPAKPDCPTCSEFGPDAYFPNPDEIDLGGASVQAAAVVGLIFLIP